LLILIEYVDDHATSGEEQLHHLGCPYSNNPFGLVRFYDPETNRFYDTETNLAGCETSHPVVEGKQQMRQQASPEFDLRCDGSLRHITASRASRFVQAQFENQNRPLFSDPGHSGGADGGWLSPIVHVIVTIWYNGEATQAIVNKHGEVAEPG
jgi:hypothetical protein